MISVSTKDRDIVQFLWLKDAFQEESEIVKLQFTRVVFRVSSIPFLLNATIRRHIERYRTSHPELVKVLMQSTYVDDVILRADTENSAYVLYANSKEILSHGLFNLRKFVTNSPLLEKLIEAQETTPASTRSAKTSGDPLKLKHQKRPTLTPLSLSVTVALMNRRCLEYVGMSLVINWCLAWMAQHELPSD